jgi:hypothetical protein
MAEKPTEHKQLTMETRVSETGKTLFKFPCSCGWRSGAFWKSITAALQSHARHVTIAEQTGPIYPSQLGAFMRAMRPVSR